MLLHSYAKINLHLEVLSRLPDGYHDIYTLFERIDLADTITLEKTRDARVQLRCSHPDVPVDATNLCARSAELLRRRGNLRHGVRITIRKRIPVAAGLGGGSSNAACVLEGLNRLWKCGLTRRQLLMLGRRIGADVPFFLYDTPLAVGTGRGDRIKPYNKPIPNKLWHIIVVPDCLVSTPRIYQEWDTEQKKRGGKKAPRPFSSPGLTKQGAGGTLVHQYINYLKKKDLGRHQCGFFNSLEPITERLYPEVGRIKRACAALGVSLLMMSGSGPTVFGIVDSRGKAQAVRTALQHKNASWRIFVAQTR